jgi:hypothetical protein
VNLANAGLGLRGVVAESLPDLQSLGLDDVVYLPPVPPRLATARTDLAAALLAAGTPVLVEQRHAEVLPAGAVGVIDLLPDLLADDLSALGEVESGSAAVWPLIAGITDSAELWERACVVLAAAGVSVLQPLTLELSPVDRRRLADRCPHVSFERLFHAQPPAERSFSRVARRHGLRPFLERPLPAGGLLSLALNRRSAAALALAGELWLRLGRDEAGGQALLAAARRVDLLPHDLCVLAREGNLGLLDWLGVRGRAVVEECLLGPEVPTVDRLLAEYLAGEAPT